MRISNMTTVAVLIVAGSVFMSISCNNGARNNGVNNKDSLSAQVNKAKDTANQKVKAFENKWNGKMNQLNKKITEWQKDIDGYSGKKKEQAQQKLDSLKAQKERFEKKLNKASDQTETQWQQFKKDVKDSYDSLSDQLNRKVQN